MGGDALCQLQPIASIVGINMGREKREFGPADAPQPIDLDVQRVKTAIDLRQMIGFEPSDSEVLGDRYEIIGMLVLYLAQITGRLQEVVADPVDKCLRHSGRLRISEEHTYELQS